MPKKSYDLIVIGSGAGAKVAYHAAHHLKWKVALIEEAEMGGTCLNHGCIPSKILIQTADLIQEIKRSKTFGITTQIKNINFRQVMKRATDFVDPKSKAFEQQVKKDKSIDLYQDRAMFINENQVQVGNKTLTGKRFVIATGSRPHIPPIEGLSETPFITSKEALRLKKLPKSMIIIGGGYIAAELGHFYGQLGTKVTIIEQKDHMLGNEDKEIAHTFTKAFQKSHQLVLESRALSTQKTKHGVAVKIQTISGKKRTLKADILFITTGVRPNTDTLHVNHAGVKLDKRGFVAVNKALQTNKKHIWAIGDVNGQQLFRHAANYEAELLKHNLTAKKPYKTDYRTMPHAVFTSPQIAGVGLTEQQAIEQKKRYTVKKFFFKDTAKGKALEEKEGFVKYIIGPKETILGCHIVGPHASVLIHEVIVAMNAPGAKTELLEKSIHIHPALNEAVWWALTKN